MRSERSGLYRVWERRFVPATAPVRKIGWSFRAHDFIAPFVDRAGIRVGQGLTDDIQLRNLSFGKCPEKMNAQLLPIYRFAALSEL